jgi:hypothetical protein
MSNRLCDRIGMPHAVRHRNFYRVEKWTKDGTIVGQKKPRARALSVSLSGGYSGFSNAGPPGVLPGFHPALFACVDKCRL